MEVKGINRIHPTKKGLEKDGTSAWIQLIITSYVSHKYKLGCKVPYSLKCKKATVLSTCCSCHMFKLKTPGYSVWWAYVSISNTFHCYCLVTRLTVVWR
jgi:hypothetical protein